MSVNKELAEELHEAVIKTFKENSKQDLKTMFGQKI